MKSLKTLLNDYLKLRWRLGFKSYNTSSILNYFVEFLKSKKAKHISNELSLCFATINPNYKMTTCEFRLSVIRQFALYLSTIDPNTEVPPHNLLPSVRKHRLPYIYSDQEIIDLMQCLDDGTRNALDQYTFQTLFGLLAVTGMRAGEAFRLEQADVDTVNRIITIRQSKFGKSRYIPIHKTTAEALKRYFEYKDKVLPNPKSSQFFINHHGFSIAKSTIRNIFHRRLKKVGIKNKVGHATPRIADLRHSFSIKTLLNWYRNGVKNIDHCIPLLSTYLGHVNPTNTYWYITETPELLNFAIKRLKIRQSGRSL
jgi:integrase/recombinase XerD